MQGSRQDLTLLPFCVLDGRRRWSGKEHSRNQSQDNRSRRIVFTVAAVAFEIFLLASRAKLKVKVPLIVSIAAFNPFLRGSSAPESPDRRIS